MYRHPLDRPRDDKRPSLIDWEEVSVFVHVNVAFLFIIIGLEILLPWTVWPLLTGIYLALWVGVDMYKQLWGRGVYILIDEDQTSVSEE